VIEGRVLVEGEASGPALVLEEPLSFWGGLDPLTGRIIDHRHPQQGEDVRGRILVLPAGRGSSSSSTVLAEAIRLGTAPAGILLAGDDAIVVVGALVAADLYGVRVPIVQVDRERLAVIRSGDAVSVDSSGVVTCDAETRVAD
jgi:predicted aconitase with swiveling domain